jgi:hypothetical protein
MRILRMSGSGFQPLRAGLKPAVLIAWKAMPLLLNENGARTGTPSSLPLVFA